MFAEIKKRGRPNSTSPQQYEREMNHSFPKELLEIYFMIESLGAAPAYLLSLTACFFCMNGSLK